MNRKRLIELAEEICKVMNTAYGNVPDDIPEEAEKAALEILESLNTDPEAVIFDIPVAEDGHVTILYAVEGNDYGINVGKDSLKGNFALELYHDDNMNTGKEIYLLRYYCSLAEL